MKQVFLGLCRGKDRLPVKKYIFDNIIIDEIDIGGLEELAYEKIQKFFPKEQEGSNARGILYIYITDCPLSAIIATINAAKLLNIAVFLLHYTIDYDTYYPQYCY